MIIKELRTNTHSHDDCKFNRNFLYSRRILQIFCSGVEKHTIQVPGKRHRNRPSRMSDSEIMTILILFHTHHFRDLKSFYLGYVCQHMRKDFPNPVSYNRFVERQAQVGLHLFLTSSLKKHTFYNLLINNILYLCVT